MTMDILKTYHLKLKGDELTLIIRALTSRMSCEEAVAGRELAMEIGARRLALGRKDIKDHARLEALIGKNFPVETLPDTVRKAP